MMTHCTTRLRALIPLSALLLAAGCHRTAPPPQQPPPQVTVTRPVQRDLADTWEFLGQLEAVERTDIRARVRGFLQKIAFKEGVEVKAGDLLYEIEPDTYQADVERARADVERAQAQLTLATAEAERGRVLSNRNAISPEEYQTRVANRDTARAALDQARAGLRNAEIQLGYARIHSPIDGRVGRTLVTLGNLVGYSEPTLLTTVVRLDPVYVYFESSEREFLKYQELIRAKAALPAADVRVPVFVGLADEQGYPHQGVIDYRDNRVDPGTGTITVRGTLSNPDRILTPGLSARVRVPIGQPRPRLLIPEVALSADQRGTYVLVVKDDDTVEPRLVTPGRAENGLVIIDKGLEPNDRVVVSGLQRARPGTQVQVREVPPGQTAEGPPQPAAPVATTDKPQGNTQSQGNTRGGPNPGTGHDVGPAPGGSPGPTPRSDQAPATAPPIGRPPPGAKTGQAPGS